MQSTKRKIVKKNKSEREKDCKSTNGKCLYVLGPLKKKSSEKELKKRKRRKKYVLNSATQKFCRKFPKFFTDMGKINFSWKC